MGRLEGEGVRTYSKRIKENIMAEKDIVFLNSDGSVEFCEYMDLPRMERNLQILEQTKRPFKIFNPVLQVCKIFKGEIIQIKDKEGILFNKEDV